MSSEYYRRYTAGRMSAQPEWISMEDQLPPGDGDYFTITEAQEDFPACPKGTIAIDTTEQWHNGKWYQDGGNWKVLYWAKPVTMLVPEELMNRPRLGSL